MSNVPKISVGKPKKKGALIQDPVILLCQLQEKAECITKQIEILDDVISESFSRTSLMTARIAALDMSLSKLNSDRDTTFKKMNVDMVDMEATFSEKKHALAVELTESIRELDILVAENKQLAASKVEIVSARQLDIAISNRNIDDLVAGLTVSLREILTALTSSCTIADLSMTTTSVLASLGTAVGICMALAPIPTMRTILNSKSTGDFSVFPYIVTFCQCLLWMAYALITPGKLALLPVNAFIVIVEGVYCGIFLKFSSSEKLPALLKTMAVPLGVAIGAAMLSLITSSPSKFVGFFAVISNIIMYAAPLAVVKTVVETQSVKYMPFLLSFVGTIASIIWTSWAVSSGDAFVLVPNALGIFLGLIQLAVYAKYRNSDTTEETIHRYYTTTTGTGEPENITVDSSLIKVGDRT